jgi:hypothetical protein
LTGPRAERLGVCEPDGVRHIEWLAAHSPQRGQVRTTPQARTQIAGQRPDVETGCGDDPDVQPVAV